MALPAGPKCFLYRIRKTSPSKESCAGKAASYQMTSTEYEENSESLLKRGMRSGGTSSPLSWNTSGLSFLGYVKALCRELHLYPSPHMSRTRLCPNDVATRHFANLPGGSMQHPANGLRRTPIPRRS